MHDLSAFAHFEISGSIDWPGTPIWKSSRTAAFRGLGEAGAIAAVLAFSVTTR